MPSVSVREWIAGLRQRGGSEPLLLEGSLELTERCNLCCVHCYVNRPAGDERARSEERSLEEWQGVLDQLARAGVLWLLVTGGEPLLRPDFAAIYLYAKRKGFHVTLFTNGTLLTPDLADLLAEYPPWEVEITLYGVTAATYERVTGVPGSYALCRQAIDLLRQRGVALSLKTMALTLNRGEIRAMQELADAWGLRFRYDPAVHSRLDGSRRPLDYRLSPEEVVALEKEDPKRLQQWQEFCGRPWLPQDANHLFNCGAALNTFHLDPYGGVYPCLLARWLRYDLRAGTLAEARRGFLSAVRQLPVTHDRTCWECDVRVLCENCPAWAYGEAGDPEAPEPFRCRLAHLRCRDLGLSVRVVRQGLFETAETSGH
jgi:radical SAM protein with 4Fe4S-binding SPASM domain